jgi:predicted nucleotidyltransferase
MPESGQPVEQILKALQERAKELNCLYRVEEILHSDRYELEEMLRLVAQAVPPGWQYPSLCVPRIQLRDLDIHPEGFTETPWVQKASIEVQGERIGAVSVYYSQRMPDADEGPFLKEERRLIDTIAVRIGHTILHRELTRVFEARRDESADRDDWRVVLDVLRRTDQDLFRRVTRKMLNHLSREGVEDARRLLASWAGSDAGGDGQPGDENRPTPRGAKVDEGAVASQTFHLAAEHLHEEALLALLQMWMKEDRVHFLLLALESSNTSLAEIAGALERYQHTGVSAQELSTALHVGIKVSLIRRLLTDQLGFIDACRNNVRVEDFFDLMNHTILLPKSHGRLGGKASGLFLASRILRRAEGEPALQGIRTPRTWYLPSDGIVQFIAHNNLDDVYNWKYQDLGQVRQEFPNLLQVFKSSRFPAESVQGIATALDDFGERPIIVRSSSLLEDRVGSAFAGKYRSLFLANQGTKAERLAALLDAIAEVYASVFGPDPIQYRAERGLLDTHEEMAIMIQEVVGSRMGRYFAPAWAGVAFRNNELRWSPRIRREDGLLRLVPGLGTRAVDRLADDYPMLATPGQPGLRVNVQPEEVVRYSPRKVDVIDLENHGFTTLERHALLREVGHEYPDLQRIVSIWEHDMMRRPGGLDLTFARDNVIFTFEGLLSEGPFVERMKKLLEVLSEGIGAPADVEFAHDGRDFYLLQCRPQSHAPDAAPAPIPRDLPPQFVLFSANRYVSNGTVPDVTHIVYVDPEAYSRVEGLDELRAIGRAVGALNKMLPKRQFILMGPGRWGSRGDVKLGVSVGYSDISNAAVLVEIARKQGHYVPDLSFGTHFFQDLVEASIRYLPLYPDDEGVSFNEAFFRHADNLLPRLLPEFAALADTLRVIDVPGATGGRVLRILMNADLDEAVGVLAPPGQVEVAPLDGPAPALTAARPSDDHSRWRLRMAQRIAAELDPTRFGVAALYVFGSAKNGTAGPGSDLDLLIHFTGREEQSHELELWLEGWSQALAEINYLRTGYRSGGLLDVHLVTDEDIRHQTSYAVKIGAVTDAARPLALGGRAL